MTTIYGVLVRINPKVEHAIVSVGIWSFLVVRPDIRLIVINHIFFWLDNAGPQTDCVLVVGTLVTGMNPTDYHLPNPLGRLGL